MCENGMMSVEHSVQTAPECSPFVTKHRTVRRAELFKELEAAVADAHGEQARRSGALDGRGARATVRRAELFKELEAAVANAHGEQAR